MKLVIISFCVIGLSILGMAIGVLMKRDGIKGSCGGLNNFQGAETKCPICSNTGKCENK